MSTTVLLRLGAAVLTLAAVQAQSASRQYALDSATGLRLHNVTASPATLDGKRGIRVVASEKSLAAGTAQADEQLAIVEGLEFGNGAIEAEIAGSPRTDIFKDARGFVGIAFRVQPDLRTYDAFYLRPTNGRADDQVRRNHSAQYISHPDWPWFRLRKETPERYESYVDLVPGVWTKIRIEVKGTQARLFVHGQPQPTLIVNDVKTGAGVKGAVALWTEVSTEAHFRELKVTPE